MFVRQLIGRSAGGIVEMPYHVGMSNIQMGTCAPATEDEIALSGLQETIEQPSPDDMPDGFTAVPAEGGGYDILNAMGKVINKDFVPNMAAARSAAKVFAANSEKSGVKSKASEPEKSAT